MTISFKTTDGNLMGHQGIHEDMIEIIPVMDDTEIDILDYDWTTCDYIMEYNGHLYVPQSASEHEILHELNKMMRD